MSWNGSGTYSRTNGTHSGSTTWVQDRDNSDKILATRHDTHDQDLADGINACLAKNGENAMTGDLNLDSNDINNIANLNVTGTTAIDLVDNGNPVNIGVAAGAHLALDPAAIQGKGSASTAAAIALNKLGGDVNIGAQSGTGDINLYSDGSVRVNVNGATTTVTGTLNASVALQAGGTAAMLVGGNISDLTNDSGFTTNTGDITGVTAGTNLTGGGTSGSVTVDSPDASESTKGAIEIATAAEAKAGTSNLLALTPGRFAGNQSLAEEGYCTLPGGFTFQWGRWTTSLSGAGNQAITFPTAFTTLYTVVATPLMDATTVVDVAEGIDVDTLSTTGFSYYHNTTITDGFTWMATGYIS